MEVCQTSNLRRLRLGEEKKKKERRTMSANAQRDGRPAYYRWRPLFNAAVWLTPTTRVPCSNAAKTRNPLKFAGVPQTCQQISAVSSRSSPYYEDMWRRYRCLTRFWATVCKTVHPMLSVRCLSCPVCLSVCNVRALWPNGWTNVDET